MNDIAFDNGTEIFQEVFFGKIKEVGEFIMEFIRNNPDWIFDPWNNRGVLLLSISVTREINVFFINGSIKHIPVPKYDIHLGYVECQNLDLENEKLVKVKIVSNDDFKNNLWGPFIYKLKGNFMTIGEENNELQLEQQKNPWEIIEEYSWDRKALEMWWNGSSCAEIAVAVSRTHQRVTNRISELRKLYGEDIVPKNARRISLLRKRT